MDIKPGTSSKADKSDGNGRWLNKEFKVYSWISYIKLEEQLVLDEKNPSDGKPAEAFKHKKVNINYL